MRLINGDHLEERVRKIIKDYAQAAKDNNMTPGRVIFSSCGVIGLVESEPTMDAVPVTCIEELEQFDYELYCHTGKSHLSEQQWKWLKEVLKSGTD